MLLYYLETVAQEQRRDSSEKMALKGNAQRVLLGSKTFLRALLGKSVNMWTDKYVNILTTEADFWMRFENLCSKFNVL